MDSLDNDFRVENLLASHLDALTSGQDTTPIKKNAPADTRELLDLAFRLNQALIAVEPSAAFLARLKSEFVEPSSPALLLRWRKLPPRYRIAAQIGGFTLTAGLALLAGRRAAGMISGMRSRHDAEPDPALSAS